MLDGAAAELPDLCSPTRSASPCWTALGTTVLTLHCTTGGALCWRQEELSCEEDVETRRKTAGRVVAFVTSSSLPPAAALTLRPKPSYSTGFYWFLLARERQEDEALSWGRGLGGGASGAGQSASAAVIDTNSPELRPSEASGANQQTAAGGEAKPGLQKRGRRLLAHHHGDTRPPSQGAACWLITTETHAVGAVAVGAVAGAWEAAAGPVGVCPSAKWSRGAA
ncbi:hypothetical protein EYF80_062776 [Liparis tanakae]|uniref:Uncharacterized protein n=1 Tax=Liparis tanakae TaxID=230148 RepID=A0A4Z2EFJ5_9TELE|nr:hypothetical protein EYF80_062776 [Liparis tanakae]